MSDGPYVYTRDASWWDSPSTNGGKYHFEGRATGVSACGGKVLDDEWGGMPAADVAVVCRCMGSGCRQRWAALDRGTR